MKIRLVAVLISSVLLMGLQSSSLAGTNDDVNLKEHYGAIIDNLIDRCKFNTSMRNSKSEVIRKAAMLSCLKTTFYQNNREELIQAIDRLQQIGASKLIYAGASGLMFFSRASGAFSMKIRHPLFVSLQ